MKKLTTGEAAAAGSVALKDRLARAVVAVASTLAVTLAALVGSVGGAARVAALTPPPAGQIGPVAGSGTGAAPGPALNAALNGPSAVACGGGNCYIAEANAHRVRKVDSGGTITVFAGTGKQGYSGDGGPATAALLNNPNGVAVDGAGNVYIADTNNGVIRMVTPAGTISTVAGGGASFSSGPATSIHLASPWSVTVRGSDFYVADFGGFRVWRISGGSATLWAGNGSPATAPPASPAPATSTALPLPSAVAFDSAGNGYIACPIANTVLKVDTGGTISKFAGTGSLGYSGDNGAAANAQLFQPFGVGVRHTIVTVDVVTPGPNPGDPPVHTPTPIPFDTVVIADTQNARLRVVPLDTTAPDAHGATNPDGTPGNIYTALGNGTRSSAGDGGPASAASTKDPQGLFASGDTVFFAEGLGNKVRTVAASAGHKLADGTVSAYAGNGSASLGGDNGPATAATLAGPQGLATDTPGNIYIADTNNHAVREINGQSGIITTIAGTGSRTLIDNPQNPGYDLKDGGPATQATLNFPGAVAVNTAGDVFIADTFNNRIRKVDHATHVITTIAGTGAQGFAGDGGAATAAQLNRPFGVAVDSAGNVLVADTFNRRVRKIDGSGKISTIAGGGSGNVIGDGGPATSATLAFPTGLAVDPAGNIYIASTAADQVNSRVREVTPDGKIWTAAGGGSSIADGVPSTQADLSGLASIAVDPYGELFVADTLHNRIRRVNIDGTISTVAGLLQAGYAGDGGPATQAKLATPVGVAVGSDGSLLVADTGNSRVRAVGGALVAAPVAKFVIAANHDFLDAAPNPAQLENGVLATGHFGRPGFLDGMANSDPWITNVVNHFYTDTLGRTGDPDGVTYWVGTIEHHVFSVADVASRFYGSDEYFNKPGYGGGNLDTWVDDLYHKLLHRVPDAEGHTFWVGQVGVHGGGGAGRTWVAFQMYQSAESSRDRVEDLYQERCGTAPEPPCPDYRPLLNRTADPGGLEFWAEKVREQGDIVLAIDLASSNEYFDNAQTRTFP